ncbi:MAG: TRAP transporter large permease subunit, partial [Dehalococcoidia bacterium]|nr:TRAP transporter large permease subunit [Dehalococcoidia bacterium]
VSAIIYALMLYIRVRLNPSLGRPEPPTSFKEKLVSLRGVVFIPIIFIVVIGGLYLGIFTPTEAGAAGAFSVLVFALVTRRLTTWSSLKESLLDTGQTTVMIFLIIVGILIFMRLLALSGASMAFINFVTDLPVPRLVILIGFLSIYVVLGMFLTATSMLILTCPLIVPVVVALGYDPIWFGIIAIKMCEICLITPPVGLNVYVVRSVAPDIPVEDIFRGALPFFLMDVLTVAILIAFPQIILILPTYMLGG